MNQFCSLLAISLCFPFIPIHRHLGGRLQLEHPNVVKLLGVCFELRPWLAVLEIMIYGDVRKVLRACGQKRLALTESERLIILSQACSGMEFIASKGFVHMDIAARNMLIHTNNVVKIADFGITKKMDPETKTFALSGFLRLAVRWLAPGECSAECRAWVRGG